MPNRTLRVRMGALCLFASGLLTVAGLLLRGPILDALTQPEAFARGALSARHVVAWSLLLPSLALQLYGFLALHASLVRSSSERLAFLGSALSVAGNALFLPFAGVIAFVTPGLSRLYVHGARDALGVASEAFTGAFGGPFMAASALFLLLGSVSFAAAVWKAKGFPRWAAPPYAVHSLFIGFLAPHSYALERTGGVLLLVSTAAIARAMWREAAHLSETPR